MTVNTPAATPAIASLGWAEDLARTGEEGYVIRAAQISGRAVTVIASMSDVGALHGAFHLLRLMQTRRPIAAVNISERPRMDRRLLNHWDNLDGSIERGYAGASLWKWQELPMSFSEGFAMKLAEISLRKAISLTPFL